VRSSSAMRLAQLTAGNHPPGGRRWRRRGPCLHRAPALDSTAAAISLRKGRAIG